MNKFPFYVLERVDGVPHITQYETRQYADLHSRMSKNKCIVYTQSAISKRFGKLINAFMFNPFKPVRS